MLPGIEEDLSEGYEIEEEPSLVWKLNENNNRIRGTEDGIDAVRQAIFCILNTERYECIIYSWEYGVELKDLFGEPLSYILPELKRRIEDALTQDDRIASVRDFVFDTSQRGAVNAIFTVETIYGETQAEKEVII
jgi:phage baseplate assembly protein W